MQNAFIYFLSLKKRWKVVIPFLALFLFLPNEAHAAIILAAVVPWLIKAALVGGAIYLFAESIGDWLIDLLYYLAVTIITLILSISTGLLDFALDPGVGRISDFQLVKDMVPVTTSMANLVLVAILIIIALATIVGIESYGIRRVLPVLIGLTLLVNFSSVIAGLVIDAGQTVMNFFVNSSSFANRDIAEYTMTNFKIASILSDVQAGALQKIIEESVGTARIPFDSTVAKAIVYTLIIILGTLASYIFIRLDILLLMRFAVFWILLILAPLAFLLGIIPHGRGYLKSWFQQLLNWSFLGPIVLLFTYMGLLAWGFLNENVAAVFTRLPEGTTARSASIFIVFPLIAFFFIYAINISKKMAGAVANAIIDSVISVGKGIALGGLALAGGAALAGAGGALLRKPFVKRTYEALQRSRSRAFQATGRRLEGAYKGAVAEEAERARGLYAGLDAFSSQDLVNRWEGLTARQKVTAAGILEERKETLPQGIAQEALKLATSIDKEIERRLKRAAPHARYYSTEPAHVKTGNIRIADAYNYLVTNNIRGVNLVPQALENPAIAGLLDYRQLIEIARRGTSQQLQAVVKGVEELAKSENIPMQLAIAAELKKDVGTYQQEVEKLVKRVREEEIFKAGRIGEYVRPLDTGATTGGGGTTGSEST